MSNTLQLRNLTSYPGRSKLHRLRTVSFSLGSFWRVVVVPFGSVILSFIVAARLRSKKDMQTTWKTFSQRFYQITVWLTSLFRYWPPCVSNNYSHQTRAQLSRQSHWEAGAFASLYHALSDLNMSQTTLTSSFIANTIPVICACVAVVPSGSCITSALVASIFWTEWKIQKYIWRNGATTAPRFQWYWKASEFLNLHFSLAMAYLAFT
jgi:hypothetical protein